MPVNVVFLGYEPIQVDRSGDLASLPAWYEPVDEFIDSLEPGGPRSKP